MRTCAATCVSAWLSVSRSDPYLWVWSCLLLSHIFNRSCLSYHRMSAESAMAAQWSGKPKWIDFKRDPAVDGLSAGRVQLVHHCTHKRLHPLMSTSKYTCVSTVHGSLVLITVCLPSAVVCLSDQYPGSVLLQVGMGPADTLPKSLGWLSSLASQLPNRRRFEIRVHIFQV